MIGAFREAARSIVRGGEPELGAGLREFVMCVFDLDAALEMGFTITLAEVTPLEFRGLMVVREERARYQEQQRAMEEQKGKMRRGAGAF